MLKKIIVIISLLILNCNISANDSVYNNLIKAIAFIESSNNPLSVSKDKKYVGLLQISKILVDDCNRIIGKEKYTYDDRYNPTKSIEMFKIYQKHYNPNNDFEHAIRLWNGGPHYTIKSTDSYYKLVWDEYKKNNKKINYSLS